MEENKNLCIGVNFSQFGDVTITIKTEIIDKIGGYVYDEIASPLGCERELTYRANYFGYKVKFNNSLYFRHVHDISLNPTTMINYMGKLMSPLGENAFQYKTIELLENKINFYKKIND